MSRCVGGLGVLGWGKGRNERENNCAKPVKLKYS